jgi:hypothetical protein
MSPDKTAVTPLKADHLENCTQFEGGESSPVGPTSSGIGTLRHALAWMDLSRRNARAHQQQGGLHAVRVIVGFSMRRRAPEITGATPCSGSRSGVCRSTTPRVARRMTRPASGARERAHACRRIVRRSATVQGRVSDWRARLRGAVVLLPAKRRALPGTALRRST